MNALLIDGKDNVAVVTCAVDRGMNVDFLRDGAADRITAGEAVPIYHKIAICDIAAGESVVKYGHRIGKATQNIKAGGYVHCHNVVSFEERETD